MKLLEKIKQRSVDSLNTFYVRYLEWIRGDDNKVRAVLLLLFAIVVTYFALPDSYLLDLPVSDGDVGKIMKFSFRADRDISVVDEEATRKNRIEASEKVPNQYVSISNKEYYDRVRTAFDMMRNIIKQRLFEYTVQNGTNISTPFIPLSKEVLYTRLLNKSLSYPKPLRQELSGMKSAFDERIGRPVSDTVFAALAENFFPPEVDTVLFDIINKLDSYEILRTGLADDYKQNVIEVYHGNRHIRVPRYRVITQRTLPIEVTALMKELDEAKQLTPQGSAVVEALVYTLLRDNISFSEEKTEQKMNEARKKAPLRQFSVKYGELIRRAGEQITPRDIKIFRAIRALESNRSSWTVFLEYFLYIVLVIGVLFVAFSRNVKKARFTIAEVMLMGIQTVFLILLWKADSVISASFSDWIGNIDARIFYFLIPFPAMVALIKLLVNTESAIFFLFTVFLIFLLIFPNNFFFPSYYAIGSAAYLYLLQHIAKRSDIWRASLYLSFILVAATILIFALDMTLPGNNMGKALLFTMTSALLSGVLVMGLIPVYEYMFGYITDFTFLEYSNLNHPLLKEMAVRANGTYQHSLTVGSIVEAAAVAIGANPIACKVMAHFHDIGKLERPEYFAENQVGTNKHLDLTPSMSAKVIMRHVRYGKELARKYHLGEMIEAAAYQHHGTSLVRYFLQQAQQTDASISEETFRYPAEKPQTREVALIMIADSCEAAVKSIKEEKTYDRIRDRVHKVISGIMDDGQLSECNITLSDIAKIQESVIKTLTGIYHARPEYDNVKKKGTHENRKQEQRVRKDSVVGQ